MALIGAKIWLQWIRTRSGYPADRFIKTLTTLLEKGTSHRQIERIATLQTCLLQAQATEQPFLEADSALALYCLASPCEQARLL